MKHIQPYLHHSSDNPTLLVFCPHYLAASIHIRCLYELGYQLTQSNPDAKWIYKPVQTRTSEVFHGEYQRYSSLHIYILASTGAWLLDRLLASSLVVKYSYTLGKGADLHPVPLTLVHVRTFSSVVWIWCETPKILDAEGESRNQELLLRLLSSPSSRSLVFLFLCISD